VANLLFIGYPVGQGVAMSSESVLARFDKLTIWKQGEERAPHKPLLILYALARWQQGKTEVTFREVEPALTALLREFGPPRKSDHPAEPFWRLQNDSVWTVQAPADLPFKKGHSIPTVTALRSHNVRAGFSPDVQADLEADPTLVARIATRMLEMHFPDSWHQDILNAVGLTLDPSIGKQKRDPTFRQRVLRAYEYRCAVCGFDVRLGNELLALEAAHIRWHQYGGPDIECNGLALCVLHHKAFDRGAITVIDEILVVSDLVNGSKGLEELLLAHHNKPIQKAQRAEWMADREHMGWHRRQVFRGEPRHRG
jgi:putative restriction endonuclease